MTLCCFAFIQILKQCGFVVVEGWSLIPMYTDSFAGSPHLVIQVSEEVEQGPLRRAGAMVLEEEQVVRSNDVCILE